MQTRLVNLLAIVLVVVQLMRLDPGVNRIHVTGLNRCVPHDKAAFDLFFGRSAQVILGVMWNSGFVDVAIIMIPPVEQ